MSIEKEVFHLYPELEEDYAISRAVKVGNTIYITGSTAFNDEGEIVGPGDMGAQFRQIYMNISKTLEHFGATLTNIVEQYVFVTDISRIGEGIAVVKELWPEGEAYPTAVAVEVQALADIAMLVEIKVTACV